MSCWRSSSSTVHACLLGIIIEVSEVMHIANRDSTRVPLASDRATTSRVIATATPRRDVDAGRADACAGGAEQQSAVATASRDSLVVVLWMLASINSFMRDAECRCFAKRTHVYTQHIDRVFEGTVLGRTSSRVELS